MDVSIILQERIGLVAECLFASTHPMPTTTFPPDSLVIFFPNPASHQTNPTQDMPLGLYPRIQRLRLILVSPLGVTGLGGLLSEYISIFTQNGNGLNLLRGNHAPDFLLALIIHQGWACPPQSPPLLPQKKAGLSFPPISTTRANVDIARSLYDQGLETSELLDKRSKSALEIEVTSYD